MNLQVRFLNVFQIIVFDPEKVWNIVGEGENAGYQQFSHFPTIFSKAFLSRVFKTHDLIVKG